MVSGSPIDRQEGQPRYLLLAREEAGGLTEGSQRRVNELVGSFDLKKQELTPGTREHLILDELRDQLPAHVQLGDENPFVVLRVDPSTPSAGAGGNHPRPMCQCQCSGNQGTCGGGGGGRAVN